MGPSRTLVPLEDRIAEMLSRDGPLWGPIWSGTWCKGLSEDEVC